MDNITTEELPSPINIYQCPSTPILWPQATSCSSSASTWSSSSFDGGKSSSPITPDDSCVDVMRDRFILSPPEFRIDAQQYGYKPQICQLPEEISIQAPTSTQELAFRPSLTTLHDESYPPCLQCSLKSLPCDRGWPSCSRCTRNGHAALCLMQRSRCLEDDICEGPIRYTLRRTSETDAQWSAKELVEETLLIQLQSRIDRQNWVLPNQCGPRDRYSIGELLAAEEWRDVEHVRGVDTGCRWKERVLQLRYGLLASDDMEIDD